ncbi:fimbrial protein [Serratia marcescens]
MFAKKLMVVSFVSLSVMSSSCFAADQGHGKVGMVGSIISTPCSISPESIEQTVNLGQVLGAVLEREGKSTPRAFDIKLENCEVGSGQSITVTFNGVASTQNDNLLAISGTASGAGIAITHDDNVVKPGGTTKAIPLVNGNNMIHFTTYIQGESGKNIIPGDFSAVANFSLNYL